MDVLTATGPAAPLKPSAPHRVLAPMRSSLRWPAAASAVVAAAAHVPVTGQHLDEVPYVGWLFVGLTVVLVLGAVGLALRDAVALWTTTAAIALAAIAAYALSRGPGMPGMSDDIGDWTNPLGIISVVTEGLVVVLAMAALLSRRGCRRGVPIAVVVAGGAALTGAAYLTGVLLYPR